MRHRGHNALAPDQEFPIAIATLPATREQSRVATGIILLLLIVAGFVAPFAHLQLGRIDAFIPVLQTVLALADFTTAILLFVQFSLLPQPALLAVASAYVFSGSFALLQTLSFPGGYAPAGVIGDGFNSPAWFFVLWHATFPLAILIYALSKEEAGLSTVGGRSTGRAIGLTLAIVVAVIAALAWLVTAGVGWLPTFYSGSVTEQTRFGNQINVVLLLWYGVVLAVLFARRRTILDVWLVVILMAWMPNFLVAAIASSVRFSLGWYAARGFALFASFMLLAVLLTEMTVLYSRLANAFSLLRRERANRLMSIDAATAAIAHEIRTPLGAIALNAGTALDQLRTQPPVLEDLQTILADIAADSLRANEAISVVRGLFNRATERRTTVRAEDFARQALDLADAELRANQVTVTTEFRDNLSQVHVDIAQMQQVLLNLVRNATDAMALLPTGGRRLRLATERMDSVVILSVQDSGAGVPSENRDRIFDAFFTTKPSGMGLGLAISRTIVEGHGGKLQLATSGPQGSVFEIAMPISAAGAS
jgi:signal transduction histidine kinase